MRRMSGQSESENNGNGFFEQSAGQALQDAAAGEPQDQLVIRRIDARYGI